MVFFKKNHYDYKLKTPVTLTLNPNKMNVEFT